MDKVRKELIQGSDIFEKKLREARLRWFGHWQRKNSAYICNSAVKMEPPGKRQLGRPKRRFMNGERGYPDMRRERRRCRGQGEKGRMIPCGNSEEKRGKAQEGRKYFIGLLEKLHTKYWMGFIETWAVVEVCTPWNAFYLLIYFNLI